MRIQTNTTTVGHSALGRDLNKVPKRLADLARELRETALQEAELGTSPVLVQLQEALRQYTKNLLRLYELEQRQYRVGMRSSCSRSPCDGSSCSRPNTGVMVRRPRARRSHRTTRALRAAIGGDGGDPDPEPPTPRRIAAIGGGS